MVVFEDEDTGSVLARRGEHEATTNLCAEGGEVGTRVGVTTDLDGSSINRSLNHQGDTSVRLMKSVWVRDVMGEWKEWDKTKVFTVYYRR